MIQDARLVLMGVLGGGGGGAAKRLQYHRDRQAPY